MCLIAVGNSAALRYDLLAASRVHKDAWGVVNLAEGKARKGVGILPLSEIPAVSNVAVHLRLSTAGNDDIVNAHPIVMPRLWLMHNGHIRQLEGEFLSDSYLVAHKLDYILSSEKTSVVKAFNDLLREYKISLTSNKFLVVTKEKGELVGRAWGSWFLVRGCLQTSLWHLNDDFSGTIKAGSFNGEVIFRGSQLFIPEGWGDIPIYLYYAEEVSI
jgi:hypothetical protein